jgi:flagellar FliJ protein
MKKSQRIKTLVELKATQEKTALEALGASQRKLSAAQAQVDGLREYRRNYQEGFNQRGGGGIGVTQLLEFRSFMDKLDKAIAGQEQILDACEAELINKRKTWEGTHHRTQSLQKVCDAALREESRQENKREQLEQDERASRLGTVDAYRWV